jgi:hypothetical protein
MLRSKLAKILTIRQYILAGGVQLTCHHFLKVVIDSGENTTLDFLVAHVSRMNVFRAYIIRISIINAIGNPRLHLLWKCVYIE